VSLYDSPRARVKMNGHLTDSFQLFRGTIVASVQLSSHYIEPLAQAGKIKKLRGITIANTEHTV